MQSEIVIETGRGTIRVSLPAEILESFEDDGTPVMRDTTSTDAVAVYGELITLLEAAGHFHQAKPAAPAAAPNGGPLPPGMTVPMHHDRPCEFKEAFVNPRTKKLVPAKYQCSFEQCADGPSNPSGGNYRWSIFLDKYIQEQGG